MPSNPFAIEQIIEFLPDYLKLDRSPVSDIDSDPDRAGQRDRRVLPPRRQPARRRRDRARGGAGVLGQRPDTRRRGGAAARRRGGAAARRPIVSL
jgi:hypothetical protein